MPLNKSKGHMYPWVTYTWNPIRGCEHKCIYCYVQALQNYSTTPRIIYKELKTNLGNRRTIFVCSTGDMFGQWVPKEWIERVLEHCRKHSNTYLFQSKNPVRFFEFINLFPIHTIFGTTIETNRDMPEISRAPFPVYRMKAIRKLSEQHYDTMVSIEPVLDFDLDEMINWIEQIKPKFVSIGADSKGHNLPEPSAEKVQRLILGLGAITEVKIKKNLRQLGMFWKKRK